MKPCRLKIITACINENENESDTEVIHYVSQNKKLSYQYNDDNKISEEEKNINNFQNEEEEKEIIIRDKDEPKTKKRISKGKVYLIDGLFTKNYSGTKKKYFKIKILTIPFLMKTMIKIPKNFIQEIKIIQILIKKQKKLYILINGSIIMIIKLILYMIVKKK